LVGVGVLDDDGVLDVEGVLEVSAVVLLEENIPVATIIIIKPIQQTPAIPIPALRPLLCLFQKPLTPLPVDVPLDFTALVVPFKSVPHSLQYSELSIFDVLQFGHIFVKFFPPTFYKYIKIRYLRALTKIANPTPPIKPVNNLKILLLSLKPKN
jgi:hypothetical protein